MAFYVVYDESEPLIIAPIVYAISYHLLGYYTVKIVNMQAEKGEIE